MRKRKLASMCPQKCVVWFTHHKIPSLRNSNRVMYIGMEYFLHLNEANQIL